MQQKRMVIPADIFSFFLVNYSIQPSTLDLCGHSAVNFLAIFFYDINTKPCWIKSISLINFLGSGDDVVATRTRGKAI